MRIINLTDNYELGKEGENFVLQMGTLLKATDNTKKIRIENVNSKEVSFVITCVCTSIKNKTIVDDNTMEVDIAVATSDPKYTKTVVIRENGKKTTLKLKGEFK